MAEENNVWTSASNNAYQTVTTTVGQENSTGSSTGDTHTRIYEYMAPTIELDEMSIPLHDDIDSNSNIDASAGQHESSSNEDGDPFETTGNQSPSKVRSIGVTFPLLRINDHYYTNQEITYFSLSSVGFLPQIEVRLSCPYNDILKNNAVKEGDICSVFINPGHGSIKYYRGDYQIITGKSKDLKQDQYTERVEYHFIAELFIPKLYDGSATFQYAGTSRDALIDVAQKLGLGFFFSDAENTEDVQCWYCMSDGDQKETGQPPVMKYIKDVALHSWKNFDSFFDCWIDPRYAVTFINIAQMLGGSDMDEEIDLAVFNSAMAIGKNADGGNIEQTADEKKAQTRPMPKLLNNLTDGQMSVTAFTVNSYKEMSDSTASKTLGLTNNNYYNINNSGIQSVDEGQISMEYSIPVNADKLKNGFYIMAGPGRNLTYTQGENGSYPDQHKSVQGGQIADTQSDDDGSQILSSGNNMLSSGNTNKFYETGEQHNILNNGWLKKKYLQVRMNGINMQLMRGEKIPMFLLDYQNPAINAMGTKTEEDAIYKRIAVNGCGWFVISSIKWIYDCNSIHGGSCWETVVDVTRREWPIPGYVKNTSTDQAAEVTVENNINKGTVNEAVNNAGTSGTGVDSSTGQDNSKTQEEINTNGLKDFMVSIYNDIKQSMASQGKSVKLVSGRRWSVDANGNKIEGAPVVQEGTNWKFVNANGDFVYYSSKTSRHIYGEAFDIINGENTTFKELGVTICTDAKIITNMLEHGVYLQIETTKDDLGTGVQHYHLGTVDKTNSESIKGMKSYWSSLIEQRGSNTLTYQDKVYNLSQYI